MGRSGDEKSFFDVWRLLFPCFRVSPLSNTDEPFRVPVWNLTLISVCLSSCLSLSLQVNEHLRDILVEEQKLREASYQESHATTQKVRKHSNTNSHSSGM